MTLAQVRALLLGKKVTIGGPVVTISRYNGDLLHWHLAEERGGRYAELRTVTRSLPASYLGSEAEVLAVQLNAIEVERSGRPNALGEVADEDSLVNPYCDVVVKLADGTLALHTGYPSIFLADFSPPFRLVSEQSNRSAEINGQLPSVIGRTVYAVGYSRLYQPTTSLEELTQRARYSQQLILAPPRLQPLKVVAAKYNVEHDLIILKVRGEDGKEYLTASKFMSAGEERPFFERVIGSPPCLLVSTFAGLTPREVAAVRSVEVFAGMSKSALYYALGFPDKENNMGRGLKQLIYFGGRTYVYLDANDRVRDWQSLGR